MRKAAPDEMVVAWQSDECKTVQLNSLALPLQGSFIPLFRSPRTARRLSWAIFDSSLRDGGATQLDEAERTNLFLQQLAFMRLT
jgi:hypothetical protein